MDATKYQSVVNSDNINIGYTVKSQRVDNKSSFDSGCLTTIYILRHEDVVRPSLASWKQLRTRGRTLNRIDSFDILRLDRAASKRLVPHFIHAIILVLLDAQAFDIDTYKERHSLCDEHRPLGLLEQPNPLSRLPSGPSHRTSQHILPVLHQEVQSYEGCKRVLASVLQTLRSRRRQETDIDAYKRMALETVIVWAGDQLTCSRYRGIIKQHAGEFNSFDRCEMLEPVMGWFHEMMTHATSLHSDLAGCGIGDHGIFHAAAILGRTHIHSPSVAGTFYHLLFQLLKHMHMGQIRTLWLKVTGCTTISELMNYSPKELYDFASQIFNNFASSGALYSYERREARRPEAQRDWMGGKMIIMTRDLLEYMVFCAAVKSGDVGIMQSFLYRLLMRYIGGKNSNYAVEMAELIQRFEREYPPDMQ